MNKIKIIKYFEIFENIICIYRNYVFHEKKSKIVIVFHIVGVLLLNILLLTYNIFMISEVLKETSNGIFFFLTVDFTVFFGDIIFSLYSLCKTEAYKTFLTNLMALHNIYNNDINYNRNLKQLQTKLLMVFTVLVIITVGLNVLNAVYYLIFIKGIVVLGFLSVQLSLLRSEACFMLEYLVLYLFLTLLSNILNSLNDTLIEIQEQLEKKENKARLEINGQSYSLSLVEKVQQLAELYKCLVNLSNQLSVCFKHQMVYLLTMSKWLYTFMLYLIFRTIIKQESHIYTSSLPVISWFVISEVFTMFMVFYGGQKLSNSAMAMKRSISKLYSWYSTSPCSPEITVIKNLLTVTKTSTIDVQFANMNMGMYLIPMFLSTTITYLIIALQFNNII